MPFFAIAETPNRIPRCSVANQLKTAATFDSDNLSVRNCVTEPTQYGQNVLLPRSDNKLSFKI